ncbi:hypothetical protein PtA15_4A318 [Puccinia triticina]|uniref:RlpA-like protein double-psi beta-barrel domain-containing protein n=1 Tax=Puccinia triticina TaxID=208348 RepID=A0ABY7CFK7_9BASI|nr:uncharacterized protein PtA15_4A318 [Puccinia triticina]WAQ83869.1 hypothetical protein PtA15_4A318 [Puccinia triticina]
MHTTRMSTLGCLVFTFSISARYGHAADLQNFIPASPSPMTSPTTEFPQQLDATSFHAAIIRKARRSGSLSVATNNTSSLVVKPRWKKCSRGIKSRYCRSYHRNLKDRKSALKSDSSLKVGNVKAVSIPIPDVAAPVPVPKLEITSTPRVEVPSTPKVEVPSTPKVEVPSTPLTPKLEVPPIGLSTNSGDATYYGTGMGACGIVSNDNSMIAAASHLLFDSFPGATANPNMNPICGRKVKATYQGKSVVVEVVDRCTGCALHDLDFSPAAFAQIGPMERGRLHGMTWEWM